MKLIMINIAKAHNINEKKKKYGKIQLEILKCHYGNIINELSGQISSLSQ
jgi:hypothetical protein